MRIFTLFLVFFGLSISLFGEDLRIEIEDLSKGMNDYRIIDVRDAESYKNGHIKNAFNLPINLTYEHKSINGKLTEPDKMQTIIRDLGLNTDDAVVIYDDGTFFDASRLFWALEVYGFKNVKLLDAGFDEWKDKSLPMSTEQPHPKPSDYIASVNNKRLATKFTTQIATKSPTQAIIDARDYDAYVGKKSSAKRYGHIPKAFNIPAQHNIQSDQSLPRIKSEESLKEVYKDVDKNKKIVIYCAIGRISSTNYFALRELGYDVANYDASWKEWGNDFDLPIVNPSQNK